MRPQAGPDEVEGPCGSGPPSSVSDLLPLLTGYLPCQAGPLASGAHWERWKGPAPASIGLASRSTAQPQPRQLWVLVEGSRGRSLLWGRGVPGAFSGSSPPPTSVSLSWHSCCFFYLKVVIESTELQHLGKLRFPRSTASPPSEDIEPL